MTGRSKERTPWLSVVLLSIFTILSLLATIPLLGCTKDEDGDPDTQVKCVCGAIYDKLDAIMVTKHSAGCGVKGHCPRYGEHSARACQTHFVCVEDELNHELRECQTHYACLEDELNHGQRDCGVHYLCVPDELEHTKQACQSHNKCEADELEHVLRECQLHYICAGDELNHEKLSCGHYACDESTKLPCGHCSCVEGDHEQCPIGGEWMCQVQSWHYKMMCGHEGCNELTEEAHVLCELCQRCLSVGIHGDGHCNLEWYYTPPGGETGGGVAACLACNGPLNDGYHPQLGCGHYMCEIVDAVLPTYPVHDWNACPGV